MGFLEYAWSIFFEKDQIRTKLSVSPRVRFTQFSKDESGFQAIFPEPKNEDDDDGRRSLSLMGYNFPENSLGRIQLISLFRAAVLHASSHAAISVPQEFCEWTHHKNPFLAAFIRTLIEDLKINAFAIRYHPEAISDSAFANALAQKRMRKIAGLLNPATKIMTALLMETNVMSSRPNLGDRQNSFDSLAEATTRFRSRISTIETRDWPSLAKDEIALADKLYTVIEDAGPVTEAVFLPHTEEIGPCSVFLSSYEVTSNVTLSQDYEECLEFLCDASVLSTDMSRSDKIREVEAAQVIDSWQREKDKERKLVSKYENLLLPTQFRSIEIPEKDYTEYLRINARSKSESHRLLDSLLVARDALDEDPRKNFGVLDLQEIIQVLASKSPRMDVFMLDENLSKSYSWILLMDVSRSMRVNKDFALQLLLVLANVANEVMLDPHAWAIYAFSDRFFIIKDLKERYNANVQSRIGGLNFDGFTFMPDALKVAGRIIKSRAENMRLISVISDGWPYGYSDMTPALSETIATLQNGGISLIGIGAKSTGMESLFRANCAAYTLRDLTKGFSGLYFEASRAAGES